MPSECFGERLKIYVVKAGDSSDSFCHDWSNFIVAT